MALQAQARQQKRGLIRPLFGPKVNALSGLYFQVIIFTTYVSYASMPYLPQSYEEICLLRWQ